jgi:hypothetical protein
VRSQERDDVRGGPERVGDDRPVVHRDGRAQLAVDLGQQQRGGGDAGGAVQGRQSEEGALVIGIARTDRDR